MDVLVKKSCIHMTFFAYTNEPLGTEKYGIEL